MNLQLSISEVKDFAVKVSPHPRCSLVIHVPLYSTVQTTHIVPKSVTESDWSTSSYVIGSTHTHACAQNTLTTLHNFLHPCVGNIAWDWINSKLYWTDTAQQEIEVYDFINSHRRVIIFTGNTSRPFSIVVDPQNR